MPKSEKELLLDLYEESCRLYVHDPYGWVLEHFDWGHGELSQYNGPDEWQKVILIAIRDGLLTPYEAIQLAVASGHGIGKSALIAWIILWGITTFEDSRGVVTANTDTQLKTKTWAEVGKWHRLYMFKDLFKYTATALFSTQEEHEKTWRIDAIPWSEHNAEAFAGLHNHGKRILILFDEASKIADSIWETTEGALTDANTEILWVAFGNPTRNIGKFRECWRKFSKYWKTWNIDSRTAKMSNKNQIQKWLDSYGEDSDFFKVRVRGQFPTTSDKQFFSTDLLDKAKGKHLKDHQYNFAAKILTCDPAWWGGDETDIALRQGLKLSILKSLAKNDNDVFVAGLLAGYEDEHKADGVIIDLGYGQGIYSQGKTMNRDWLLISFGSASGRPDCANKRAEMYYLAREWLQEGGALPDDQDLYEELLAIEYDFNAKGQFIIEDKDDIKEKIGRSPNKADALVLSFGARIEKKQQGLSTGMAQFSNGKQQRPEDFDIFGLG